MSSPGATPVPAVSTAARREWLSFFRQGGWMLLAGGLAGVCFSLTHTPASQMAVPSEYSVFTTLLDSLYLLMIPAGGLQAAFAQMAATALDEEARARVRSAAWRVLAVVTGLWLLVVLATWIYLPALMRTWQIRNPWALAWTLGIGLTGLWCPVFAGLLQGRQRFFWLGNAQVISGAGRLVAVTFAVVVLGGLAAGAMAGAFAGAMASVVLSAAASWRDWWGPRSAAVTWGWVKPCVALTLGLGVGSVMLSADTLFVQAVFSQLPEGSKETAYYMAGGRIGRGLVTLTAALALVLFPRVARSAATGEPTGALKLALGATLGTGLVVAVGCTVMPTLPLKLLYWQKPGFLAAAQLVPWFCWCMLPLTAANTLINNLLARGRFAVVPWLLLVAGGYAGTLWWLRDGFEQRPVFEGFRLVVMVLGGFSVLLLLVAVLFSVPLRGGGTVARRA
ncbi:MAG: hypothetical protein IT580_06520 [Verrucomicrobiales bacterium]|nr:hypothetical protein [Verrucomicrobiales bacterium]